MCSIQENIVRRRREGCSMENDIEIMESLNRRPPKDHWGHKMKKKGEKAVRIAFVNVNGIGTHARNERSEGIRRFIQEKEIDVMGVAETNVHWGKVASHQTLWDRTKRWTPNRRLGVAYNIHQRLPTQYQPGGTATMAFNDIAHRYKSSGQDTKKLGRWSWITTMGKQECVTRFVSVYCPKRSGTGMNTVYEQQLQHLHRNPTAAFWEDLARDIVKWQSEGNQLVLMGDWNEDIVNGNLTEWMSTFGLKEAVTGIHGSNPPPTFHRGSDAIEGIVVSPSVTIKKAGYLGFGDIPGDHRGIWIEVPHKSILGYKMSEIPHAYARRLKMYDPRIVARYLDHLDMYLSAHRVYTRLRALKSSYHPGDPLTTAQAKEFEDLDKIRDKGMKYAEKHCRKLRMGKIQWSPALQYARDTITVWKLIRRRLKKCKVGARRIIRLKKKLKMKGNTNLSLLAVEAKLAKSYEKYKVCKQNDKILRRDFLESLAEAKAAAGNIKASTALQGILHREETRSMYRQIGYATKKRQYGTTKIQIQRNGQTKEITRKSDMEKYIVRENEAKFHQTEGRCPLLHGQLYKDLGSMGDGPKVQEVFNGTYVPPPGTSDATVQWLKSLHVTDQTQREEQITSWKEYQAGWKRAKEQTASGALHMAHFKAGARHPNIGWVHFHMAMLPMASGYSPSRWQQGIDVMLLKAPDVYLLEKLRTIVLYEADFNQENKRLGRDAMTKAISQGKISDEQFSRPGRSAQDNALSKRLVFDYFRFKKRPFGMCACDLKSCYDRVVHTAASLALQRVGVPKMKIKCMFTTIQRLIHRIRTAYGLSSKTFGGYSFKFRKPPQGMGQGNGAGPTIWSILSSTVFEELRSKGFSTTFISSLSMGLYELCGFSYVDDCDLIADGKTPDEAHIKMVKMLKMWEDLMEVNGAVIAPDKCWWYLIEFSWQGGTWRYQNAGSDKVIQVRDKDKKLWNLKYLPFSQAKEMVGVFLAPNGNESAQVTALKDKATQWAQRIRCSPLEDYTVWAALNQTIMKGLEYPLAATTLTESQLDSVMSTVLTSALPKSGFARTFPRAVVYGSRYMQGLGITNLLDFQYCRHIQDLIDQTWRSTPAGKLILANLEVAKLEAGVYWHMFDNPIHITWFNTTASWVIETYKYCRTQEIIFEEAGDIHKPQCIGDRAIMEVFSTAEYDAEEMLALNRCRLYSQVVSVSEMTVGYGTSINPCWFQRVRYRANTVYDWPEQGKPSQRDWELWDTAIRTHIGKCTPLGQWTVSRSTYVSTWRWFVADSLLYYNNRDSWESYQLTRSGSRTQWYRGPAEVTHPNVDTLQRTTVFCHGQDLVATGSRRLQTEPPNPTIRTSWKEVLLDQPHAKWICNWMSDPPSIQECSTILYSGRASGVSDGSYAEKWDVCTAAWILDFGNGLEIKGGGVVPGPEGVSTAYRGELGGLLGQLLVIRSIEVCCPPPNQYSIQVACDGEGALFRSLNATREDFTSRHGSFDLISQIMVLQDRIKGTLVPTHVRGHQDRQGIALSDPELLNVRMDQLAKDIMVAALQDGDDIPDALPLVSPGITQVDYKDIPICSHLASTLRELISQDRALEWWKYKGRFRTGVTYKDIHWKVMEYTMKEMSFAMKRFVAKWTSHHIGVGRMMELRRSRSKNECPRCGELHESTLHVVRCQARSARKQWKRGIKELERWMKHRKTSEDIRKVIRSALKQYTKREDFDTFTPLTIDLDLQQCLESQAKIGWTGFLEGFLSPDWAKTQEAHFRTLDLRRSGQRWAIGLSKQLWKLVFSMWNHRNEVLFTSSKVDELSGITAVKIAIQQERELGIGLLDTSFQPYLSLPLSSFSKMKSIDLRRWLCLIRQAREDTGMIYNDDIASDPAIREWVGLNRKNQEPPSRTIGTQKQRSQLRFDTTGYIE